MKNYLKLVNFELNRFFKLYLILMGLVIVCQLIGVLFVSFGFMNHLDRMVIDPQQSYIDQYGIFSFDRFVNSEWFLLPIVFCIAMLLLYVFFIWYRDWLGKNTFIYRLLMLPTKRVNIYFSKLTAIIVFVFGFISLQILLMPIEQRIFSRIVPAEYRGEYSLNEVYDQHLLFWLYPNSFADFLLMYGLGLIFVAVVFTAVLFERSYRLKGIFLAVFYGLLSFGVVILPLLLDAFYPNYFYPNEILIMLVAMGIIVLGSAVWIANYLLQHKIRV